MEVESIVVKGKKRISKIIKFPASASKIEYMENCARLGASLFDHTSIIDGYSVMDDIVYLTCLNQETGIGN